MTRQAPKLSPLSSAILAYKNKDYPRALTLFEEAARVYGPHLVEANIALCRKAMGLPAAVPEAAAPAFTPVQTGTAAPSELDAASRLLLANGGEASLSDTERQTLLAAYRRRTERQSEDAAVKPVKLVPDDWPPGLELPPLPQGPNDYLWNRARKQREGRPTCSDEPALSIVIPTFNRSRILDVTLSCLVAQQTQYPFEVIVADDGSQEDLTPVVRRYEDRLDIKLVRQRDYGYQLCAVRNLGLRTARHRWVAILDCDMAPNPLWVQSYVSMLAEDDDVALIGPRKYVDTSALEPARFATDRQLLSSLPEVITNNTVAGKTEGTVSVDWRLDHFARTENLRLCDAPFRFFSGGNVAFSRKWLEKAGWFDEAFTHWGGEDNEFGYRLFRQGCFFRALDGGLAYHQEPPGKENETDRAEGKKITINIVKEKVPYFYRKPAPIETARLHHTPLVSIYIPAYNCADRIVRCVDSALNQTITDLEVCICNDGSTDGTERVLQQHYGKHPRVRFVSQPNGGIGVASNTAVRLARGFYIGQLDSDDYLEPDAIELCLKEFMRDRTLACVYTTNRNIGPGPDQIAPGYNWPVFSREKMTTAMIAHHFRMFTARAWHLTSGFSTDITNAVDYDMYLKLSEVGGFHHVNKIAYNRVLHGENTSIRKLGAQKKNHFLVVNESLKRQGLATFEYASTDPANDACRKYAFQKQAAPMPRIVLCRPRGGLNDMFVQIAKCWAYAERHGRTLYIDARHSGMLDSLAPYFVEPEGVRFGPPPSTYTDEQVFPRNPAGKTLDGKVEWSKPLRNYVFPKTEQFVTFDMTQDHDHPCLIHEQGGGGRESVEALTRLPLQPLLSNTIRSKIASLGTYDAIHIRNTDLKTDYLAYLDDIEARLGDRIVVCTDDRRVQDAVKARWGSRVITTADIHDTDGKPLHNNRAVPRFQTNLDALTDLMILASAKQLFFTRTQTGAYSGFSRLAELLRKVTRSHLETAKASITSNIK